MQIITSTNFISETPTAVALGTFDGVHLGHRAVILAAVEAAEKERLCPAVFTFSELPKNAFLPPEKRVWPLLSLNEKLRLMEEIGAKLVVAPPFAAPLRDMPAEDFIRETLIGKLAAKHIVCGFDHRFGANAAGDAELLTRVCREEGVSVTVVPPVMRGGICVSSTAIRRLIEEGRIETARELLGHEI